MVSATDFSFTFGALVSGLRSAIVTLTLFSAGVADSIAKVAPPDVAEAPKSSAVKLETGNKQPLAAIGLIGMRTIL